VNSLNLITDRPDKNTFYNVSDLNRVESAARLLAQKLSALGYPALGEYKTDWTKTDFPTRSQMERYLGNVRKCAEAMNISRPLPKSMDNLDFHGANEIERTLLSLWELINGVESALYFCGTFECGVNL